MVENIGVDKDGVLTDLEKFQIEEGRKFFKFFGKKLVNENEYDIKEMFNCSKTLRQLFWLTHLRKYFVSIKPRDGVKELIDDLRKSGKKVYIISASFGVTNDGMFGKLFRFWFYKWLKKNEIEVDGIILCSEKESVRDKVIGCHSHQIDYMIEDKVDNAKAISEMGIPVILIDAKYNRQLQGNNIIRVKDFRDAVYKIKNLISVKEKNSYLINGNLKRLSNQEISQLSKEEKKQYFKELMKSKKLKIFSKRFDKSKIEQEEKNFKLAFNLIVRPFIKIFNPKDFGRKNIPYQGGKIYVCNHLTYADQFTALKLIRNHPVHFLAATELLKMKRGLLYKFVGCKFIDRQSLKSQGECQETLIKLVSHGKDIFVFPEGTRNKYQIMKEELQNLKEQLCIYQNNNDMKNYKILKNINDKIKILTIKMKNYRLEYERKNPGVTINENKDLLPLKEGVSKIAQITGAPIIPIGITHDYSFRSKGLFARAGEPILIAPEESLTDADKKIEMSIEKLIKENNKELLLRKKIS